MVVRRVYPSWDRLRFVDFHPESEGGAGSHEVPDDEGSAWCEQATDGDVHLIGDVQRRNLPSLEGVVLRAKICTGVHKERLSLSWRRVSPKNSWG